MKGAFRSDARWLAGVPEDLRWLVTDVEWAWIGAKMHGAGRRKKSRKAWCKAVRRFEALRLMCLGPKPGRVKVRRLAHEVEQLFDRATELSRPPPEPEPTKKQVSILDGYYASGDQDSFVFDRCSDPRRHNRRWRGKYSELRESQHQPEPSGQIKACRVYPEVLLPPKSSDRFGKWRVTVEFWPQSRRKRTGGYDDRAAPTPR